MEGSCNECVFPLSEEERKAEGICPTDTSLVYSAGTGKLSCVKELIAAGVDVNAGCECHGNGPLIAAAQGGHLDCLRELIVSGCQVNIQNNKGSTALMYAAQEGHTGCLCELINFGGEVYIQRNDGWTALMYAARYGHENCLCELINFGAGVNIQKKDGWTALMLAAANGHTKCLRELIEFGVEVDTKNEDGNTAAMLTESAQCLTMLTSAGADLNVTNNVGNTPLMLALKRGNFDCLGIMVRAGADVEYVECVKQVVGVVADINKPEMDGIADLLIASGKSYLDLLTGLSHTQSNSKAAETEGDAKKNKKQKLSKEEIDARVEAKGFDELPSDITDREIARLALLFSANTLETLALGHFGVTEADIRNSQRDNMGNTEGFNRDLFHRFRNKGYNRKDLYCKLLEAESEGILRGVNMTEVEEVILRTKPTE